MITVVFQNKYGIVVKDLPAVPHRGEEVVLRGKTYMVTLVTWMVDDNPLRVLVDLQERA